MQERIPRHRGEFAGGRPAPHATLTSPGRLRQRRASPEDSGRPYPSRSTELPSGAIPLYVDPDESIGGRRARRILSSIQKDIVQGGGTARVRRILSGPQEVYRIEVEVPDMSYVRTTLMGRDALTALLEETPEDLLRDRFVFRTAV